MVETSFCVKFRVGSWKSDDFSSHAREKKSIFIWKENLSGASNLNHQISGYLGQPVKKILSHSRVIRRNPLKICICFFLHLVFQTAFSKRGNKLLLLDCQLIRN